METEYNRLTTQQWEYIKKYLPVQRKRKYDLRDIVDGILWTLRVGGQWRNLPKSYPPWRSVYYYFLQWQNDNTLKRLNACLNTIWRKKKGKKETPSLLSIGRRSCDSQSIKTSPFINEEKGVDGNKKINGRKRHIITDTMGLTWGVVVGAANEADGVVAERVVKPLLGYLNRMEKILGDQAYKKQFMQWIENNIQGVEVEISSRPPSAQGFVPVKWRWVTERTFGSLNFFRRLDKDHEKTPKSQEAWLYWCNCQIILNRL